MIHKRFKRHSQGENALEALIAQKPDEVEPRIILANFYAAQQESERAEKAFLKAIDMSPKKVTPIPSTLTEQMKPKKSLNRCNPLMIFFP